MAAKGRRQQDPACAGHGGQAGFFTVVHALRGVAAFWVVLFHLDKTMAFYRALDQLPGSLRHALLGYGSAGVAMFFVISGFVIGHSLAGKAMTPVTLGQFVVRRSIRLDPPYWASMVLALAVGALAQRAFSFPQIAAHVFYIQELTRMPEIQIVYWTLTYEIQFYLVAAAAMMVAQRRPALRLPIWSGLYLLALWSAVQVGDWAPHGLFVLLWHAFMAGLCAYYAGQRGGHPLPLVMLVAAMVYGSTLTPSVFGMPAAVTAMLLFVLARAKRLSIPLPVWTTMLGTVSYSLYLVHGPVLEVASALWRRIDGPPLATWAMVVVTLGACLFAAAALYHAVEKPSHMLARRLFKPAGRPVSGFAA